MATKSKVNAGTQAVRQERAVAKAGGVRYQKPKTSVGKTPVNAATQASRVARADINKRAAQAKATTAANRAAATDSEGNVGEYVSVVGPKRYEKPAAPANAYTQQIRKDRAEAAARGDKYYRSDAGLTPEAKAMRRKAGVNERLMSRRLTIRKGKERRAALAAAKTG